MNDMKQPEALRLARELEGVYPVNIQDQEAAATELRRLHAENQQLRADLEAVGAGGVGPLIPATVQHQHKLSNDNDLQRENGHSSTSSSTAPQPLTVEQIDGIIRDLDPSWLDTPTGFEEEFCRAIERAHEIGGEA